MTLELGLVCDLCAAIARPELLVAKHAANRWAEVRYRGSRDFPNAGQLESMLREAGFNDTQLSLLLKEVEAAAKEERNEVHIHIPLVEGTTE
jgi:hypothetical protein